jgi:hypothetical protein
VRGVRVGVVGGLLVAVLVGACGSSMNDAAMVRRAVERQLAAVANANGAVACGLANPAGQASLAKAVPGLTCERAISVVSHNLPFGLKAALRAAKIKNVDVSGENATVRYTVLASEQRDLTGSPVRESALMTLRKQQNGIWKVSSAPIDLCPQGSASGPLVASGLVPLPDRFGPPTDALVACVGQQPILGGELSHWLKIAEIGAKLSGTTRVNPPRTLLPGTTDFLLKARWYIAEASALHIVITSAEVSRGLQQDRRTTYPSKQEYKAFLKETGETVADIQYRVRVSLLAQRLQARFHIVGSAVASQRRLDHRLAATWKALTYCRPAYAVAADCGHMLGSR